MVSTFLVIVLVAVVFVTEDDVVVTGAVIAVEYNDVPVTEEVPEPSDEDVVTTGVPDEVVVVPSE